MPDPLEWTTSAEGLLKVPVVHDAHLAEVCYSTSSLVIRVEENDYNIIFTLDGVEEANFSVWSGSIISEILIWKIGDLVTAGRDVFGTVWKPLFDRQLFDRDIEAAARRIIDRNPGSYLFVVFCSYGGTIACIAHSISVHQA